ncbi:MAG: c-type heme family protein [Planctomycetota bacterium]
MNASRLTAPLALIVLGIYLFATAPTVLAEERAGGASMSTDTLLRMLANENDVARTLYTKEIVGPGKARGIAFREDWAAPDVCAGPLPALFLRSCAQILFRSPHPLRLRLGSDYPIEASNRFNEAERRVFSQVREARAPRFFDEAETGRRVAMFPDFASAAACVTCHNQHEKTTKRDWALHDVMGATTWSWPGDEVSHEEAYALVRAYREAVRQTYAAFLQEFEGVEGAPAIGAGWPRDADALPDADQFVAACVERASSATLALLLNGE